MAQQKIATGGVYEEIAHLSIVDLERELAERRRSQLYALVSYHSDNPKVVMRDDNEGDWKIGTRYTNIKEGVTQEAARQLLRKQVTDYFAICRQYQPRTSVSNDEFRIYNDDGTLNHVKRVVLISDLTES